MFDKLPNELRRLIFMFLKNKSPDYCHLCNISNVWNSKKIEMYRMYLPEEYVVCKRCWIGY